MSATATKAEREREQERQVIARFDALMTRLERAADALESSLPAARPRLRVVADEQEAEKGGDDA